MDFGTDSNLEKKWGTRQRSHIMDSTQACIFGFRRSNARLLAARFQRKLSGRIGLVAYSFDGESTFAHMYKGIQNTTFINAAVSTFDGPCYFSKQSSVVAHMSKTGGANYKEIKYRPMRSPWHGLTIRRL